ncbi:MAG: DUF1588 domain-containing protein [Alphaproteobacteria bacterium]|nr:DUF1588 domain-containing protein [Alphaproteobacteria bacterium]
MRGSLILYAALAAVGCATGEVPDDGDTDTVVDPGPEPTFDGAFTPGPATLRRLTADQYRHAMRDLLGDVVLPSALEPDVAVDGLIAVGQSRTSISQRGVEQYETAAFDAARQALADATTRASLVPCEAAGPVDDVCAADALEPFAQRAWRRPVASDELQRLVDVTATAGGVLGSFDDGLVYGLATVLQSPSFLFREEVGVRGDDGVLRYTGVELASRLSFLLWDTLPDDALMASALDGTLTTDDGLAAQTARMLADPRARDGVLARFDDVYQLYELPKLSKDPFVFEHMSATLGSAAREQTLRDLGWLIFDQDADFRTLLTTRSTHLDPELASVYGVQAPSRDGFALAELPADDERRGLLGQISFLALHAHPTTTSATRRGRFIREALLCQEIPDPPAGVNTSIPEADASAPTLRDRLKSHLENPSCAACHLITDPVGLAFEQFDGLGRWRTTEAGTTIDPSGDVDGTAFGGAAELGEVLAADPAMPDCVVWELYTATMGRTPEIGEADLLAFLQKDFAWSGYRIQHLLAAIIASPGFRELGAPEESP